MDVRIRELERRAAAGDPTARAALERMRKKLLLPFLVRDDQGAETRFTTKSWEEARAKAREWVLEGDWGERDATFWVDVWLEPAWDPDESAQVTVRVDPIEPECEDDEEHDWEDGQPRGSGGGVVFTDTCRRCGLRRTTDTWAQRRDTGEQGLTRVSYEQGIDYDDHDDHDNYDDDDWHD